MKKHVEDTVTHSERGVGAGVLQRYGALRKWPKCYKNKFASLMGDRIKGSEKEQQTEDNKMLAYRSYMSKFETKFIGTLIIWIVMD
eukprot:5149479-Heterocapsa_arctica.AAC.1